ncbi:MAG: Hsp20/alpha crystallin family protein [Deltaproteobacteria bacterium]|nr:Hsp20/alpha crystallin family protein [Deltaproteobacteria bacterium]
MILRKLGEWPASNWRSSFEELENLRKQMDRLMGSYTADAPNARFAGVFPLANLSEDKDAYYIRAELPGIKADELDISITGSTIGISGERKISAQGEDVKYHRRERDAGSFSRVITLPGQVDSDKAEARSSNGVLTIILPKAESAKSKQISVKAS